MKKSTIKNLRNLKKMVLKNSEEHPVLKVLGRYTALKPMSYQQGSRKIKFFEKERF